MSEPIGCGDNSCLFKVLDGGGGMRTNGGCRCFEELVSWSESAQRWNREEVRRVRRWTMMLVRRVLEAGTERVPKEPDCADCGLHGAEFCWVCLGKMEKERDEARAEVERLKQDREAAFFRGEDDGYERGRRNGFRYGAEAMREAAAKRCEVSPLHGFSTTVGAAYADAIRALPVPEDKP